MTFITWIISGQWNILDASLGAGWGGDEVTSSEYNDLRVEIVDTQIRIIDLEKRVEQLERELSHVKDKTRDEIINGLLNALSAK